MGEKTGALLKRAYALKKKDPERALIIYEGILDKDPKNLIALINKCDCLDELGKYEKELDFLDKILQSKNFKMMIFQELSNIENNEKIQGFEILYTPVRGVGFHIGKFFSKKQNLLENLKRFDEAMQCYTEYMVSEGVDGHLFERAKMIQERFGDKEYMEELKIILKIFPNHYPSNHILAIKYFELGEYEDSLKYHKKILEIYPDSLDSKQAIQQIEKEIASKTK